MDDEGEVREEVGEMRADEAVGAADLCGGLVRGVGMK